MSGLTMAGNVHAAVLSETGAFSGFLDKMNSTELTISAGEATQIPRKSRLHDTDGQILDTAITPGDPNVSLTSDENGTANILALAMLGEVAAVNEAGGSITDESVTARHDLWIPLAGKNIAQAGFVVTDDPETTTYVEGDDYEVDRVFGMLKILSGGAITDGQALLVDYDNLTVSGEKVRGVVKSSLRLRILMNGKNKYTGRKGILLIRDCELSPGGINVLANEPVAAQYSGLIRTPDDGSDPFEMQYLDYAEI